MDKKIKVAIVENNFMIGGVQKLAVHQLRALDRTLFEPYLVTLVQFETGDFYDQVPADVPVVKLHFTSPRDIRAWFQLYKTLRDIRPDIVKSSMYLSNTIVRVLKPLLGYQVITAEHNTSDGKGKLQRCINRLLHRLSVTTIVDSQMVADHLSNTEQVSRSHYTVLYNGVDLEAVEASKREFLPQRATLRTSYGILPHDILFLAIGRMVRQKNHLRMVESFGLLRTKRSDVKLMIVGDGGLKPQVEAKIHELGLQESIVLIPSRTDIHQFYAMSDITVLSSDNEGFCIAAMEGLAFGAPLVSTRVAGVVEYLRDGENGFFADKTPEDLAKKMEQILTLPREQFAQLQHEAEKTAGQYSVKMYGEKFNAILTQSVR